MLTIIQYFEALWINEEPYILANFCSLHCINEFLYCDIYSCQCFIYFHFDGQLLVMSCQKISKWNFWENTVIQLLNNDNELVLSPLITFYYVLLAAPFSHIRERQGQGICSTRFVTVQLRKKKKVLLCATKGTVQVM